MIDDDDDDDYEEENGHQKLYCLKLDFHVEFDFFLFFIHSLFTYLTYSKLL